MAWQYVASRRPKAVVCISPIAGIAGSNPDESIDFSLSYLLRR